MEAIIVDKEEVGKVDRRGRPRGTGKDGGKYNYVANMVKIWIESEDFKTSVLKASVENARRVCRNMRTCDTFWRVLEEYRGMFKICVSKDEDAILFVAKGD
jgi:hypothetical protein